jgi:hypothetical protein
MMKKVLFALIALSLMFAPAVMLAAPVAAVIPLPVDINPTSCMNPLNVDSKGVLSVAILGTEDLDVAGIELAEAELLGVAPLRIALEDVATPYEPYLGKGDAFDCNNYGPDGYTDLILKFERKAVVEALGPVNDGDVLVLGLTGVLADGTSFVGEDVVVILKKGK